MTPAVTSKKPETKDFKSGFFSAYPKKAPSKTISRIPQAINIKAHILKQLSAAEIMDSTTQTELLFSGFMYGKEKLFSFFEIQKTRLER